MQGANLWDVCSASRDTSIVYWGDGLACPPPPPTRIVCVLSCYFQFMSYWKFSPCLLNGRHFKCLHNILLGRHMTFCLAIHFYMDIELFPVFCTSYKKPACVWCWGTDGFIPPVSSQKQSQRGACFQFLRHVASCCFRGLSLGCGQIPRCAPGHGYCVHTLVPTEVHICMCTKVWCVILCMYKGLTRTRSHTLKFNVILFIL